MTGIVEWPLAIRAAGWGKQAFSYARRGAAMATRIATLESRVTALEEALSKQPPDTCQMCGERAMRRIESSGIMGERDLYRHDWWKCGKCGQTEPRIVRF
jgi:hypothetical protein